MNQPPDWIIEIARETALQSPCAKSKRGVVLFNPGREQRRAELGNPLDGINRSTIVASRGFNGQPAGFRCTGSAACRRDCAKLCLHAEQRAIFAAGALDDLADLELLHVEVIGGEVVPGKSPCCWQCSRLVVEVGVRGVWLYEHDGRVPGAPGLWRFYRAAEFHRETLRACGIGDAR